MKKILLLAVAAMTLSAASAQVTVQGSKFTDNLSVTLKGGIVSPFQHYAFWKSARPVAGIELRKQVNEFTEHLADECEKIDFLAPIRELVENAKSLEEVRDKLIGCYGEMPMDKIAEEMEQAFLAADLAGRFSILKKAGVIDG